MRFGGGGGCDGMGFDKSRANAGGLCPSLAEVTST